jgi:hypothetical protein
MRFLFLSLLLTALVFTVMGAAEPNYGADLKSVTFYVA